MAHRGRGGPYQPPSGPAGGLGELYERHWCLVLDILGLRRDEIMGMTVREVRQAIDYCRTKEAWLTGGSDDGSQG